MSRPRATSSSVPGAAPTASILALALASALALPSSGCAAAAAMPPRGPGARRSAAVEPGRCPGEPICDGAAGPDPGPKRAWRGASVARSLTGADHRGRDLLVAEGDAQWLIAKFAYGPMDADLEDEEVDVFAERECGAWEKLGTAMTTRGRQHAPIDGVEDTGGRVFFEVPKERALGLGRHRVRLVVAGDHSSAELVVDVVPPGAPIFVSDVDGTLTESETAELPRLVTGSLPEAHPYAARALAALAAKGFHPVYLTARPEWLTRRTRAFLARNGFPPGIIRTTTSLTGNLGKSAAAFKSGELARLQARGFTIEWGFGNQPSDTDAYEAAAIAPRRRVFFHLDDKHGGRRIESYAEILSDLTVEADRCP